MDDNLIKVNNFINECKQFSHYQFLNERPDHFDGWEGHPRIKRNYCKWIMSESNCPTLLLDIEFPHEEVAKEAEALLDRYIKHRGDIHPGWASIAVHGQGSQYTDSPDSYIQKGVFTKENSPPFDWTDIADQCPVTVDWLKKWPFEKLHRCRFMLLEPGGYIRPHKDFDQRKLAAFNIAITNPDGVEFAMQDAGLVPWKPGDVRGIDVGRQHSVINNSDKNRIHMIVHGNWGEGFEDLICRSFDSLLESIKT